MSTYAFSTNLIKETWEQVLRFISRYSGECRTKKPGLDVSALLAHPSVELLNQWNDFKKVAWFIEINKEWLLPLLCKIAKQR